MTEKRTRFKWTDEAVSTLAARYPDVKTEVVAAEMGCTVKSIYSKAAQLGLRKSAAFLSSKEAGCFRQGTRKGAEFWFKKGHEPWNKGLPFQAGGKSSETRFKPGAKPAQTQPLGTLRITKDGTLQKKVTELQGNNSKRWRGVHELVWVAANGPVPAGHIVVFKRGTRTNKLEEITLEKVECISYAENMRRNSVHRLPKELAELVQLRGAINRQINRRNQYEK